MALLGSVNSKKPADNAGMDNPDVTFLQRLVLYLEQRNASAAMYGGRSNDSSSVADLLQRSDSYSPSVSGSGSVSNSSGVDDADADVSEFDGDFATLYNSRIAKMNALQKMLYDERIQNEGTVHHENVVKRIQELMNVDEETAKLYRSVLFRKIGQENPGLGNVERSRKMSELFDSKDGEKQVTKTLKAVDVDAVRTEIARIREQKEKDRANRPPRTDRPDRSHRRRRNSDNGDRADRTNHTDNSKHNNNVSDNNNSVQIETATEEPKRVRKTKAKATGGDYLNTSDVLLSSN
jgi:hypothetical protein